MVMNLVRALARKGKKICTLHVLHELGNKMHLGSGHPVTLSMGSVETRGVKPMKNLQHLA